MTDAISIRFELENWGKWIRVENQTGLGYPRTSPMFRDYRPAWREGLDIHACPVDPDAARVVDFAIKECCSEIQKEALRARYVRGIANYTEMGRLLQAKFAQPINRHAAKNAISSAEGCIAAFVKGACTAISAQ